MAEQSTEQKLLRPVPDSIPDGLPFGPSPGYPNADQVHRGKDWLAPKGTPCWFREAVTITFAGFLGELGNYVQGHAADRWWGLAHLSYIDVQIGQEIGAGEPVGLTGGVPGEPGAGLTTGPHLHEECRVGSQWGERVDPDSVLEEIMARTTEQQGIIDFLDVNTNIRAAKIKEAAAWFGYPALALELGVLITEQNAQIERLKVQWPE